MHTIPGQTSEPQRTKSGRNMIAPAVRKLPNRQLLSKEWEQRRRKRAAEIEANRSIGKREASSTRIHAGYGADRSRLAYVQAHVSELKTSPFAEPVFSPGRRTYSVANSRSLRLPNSRSPETRVRKCASARFAPSSACPRRRKHQYFGNVNRDRDAGRLATAAGLSPRLRIHHHLHEDRERGENAANSSSLVSSQKSAGSAFPDSGASTDAALRPVSAPSAPRTRRNKIVIKLTSPSGPRCASSGGRRPPLLGTKKEAHLLEKLNGRSVFQRSGQYPTVFAFKAALAIEAVRTQLREESGLQDGQVIARGGSGAQHRAATAPRSSSSRHSKKVTSSDSVIPGEWHAVPWNNRSPFIRTESSVFSRTAQPESGDRATSAPSLRSFMLNDPVFGNDTSDVCYDGQRLSPSKSPSAAPRKVESELGFEEELQVDSCSSNSFAGEGARVAAAQTLQEKFTQLTVGVLIELNHLHKPPKPVLVVLAALVYLLGLKSSLSGVSRHRRRWRALVFSNAHVLRNILASVCPRKIQYHRLSSLAQRLSVREAAPAKVKGASAAAAVLLEWLLAVVACARAEGVASASASASAPASASAGFEYQSTEQFSAREAW